MENSIDTSSQKTGNEGVDHSIPEDAFLIIRGTKSVPLNREVIKIGRHHDNTIVIDDPRVSRHHAELHAINGHFDLFDLNSSGGTFINGQRTGQAMLYHGDRISLAGVELLFTQNAPLPNRGLRGDTSALIPGTGERGTAFFGTSFFHKKK